jgi:hypothetical protein
MPLPEFVRRMAWHKAVDKLNALIRYHWALGNLSDQLVQHHGVVQSGQPAIWVHADRLQAWVVHHLRDEGWCWKYHEQAQLREPEPWEIIA